MITSEEVIACYEATGWTPVPFRLYLGPKDNPTAGCALGVVARRRLGFAGNFSVEQFDPHMTEREWAGIASGFNYAFSGQAIDPVMQIGTDKVTSVAFGADPRAWERGAQIGYDVREWWEMKQEVSEEVSEELSKEVAEERELLPA